MQLPDEEHCGLRMLMLDVRNAIAGILDRYTVADVVDVTTRKMKRDGIPLPFSTDRAPPRRVPRGPVRPEPVPRDPRPVTPVEGLLSNLFPDYTI